MILRCAKCGKHLGAVAPFEDTRTSHGLCLKCALEQLKAYVEPEDYLQRAAQLIRRIRELRQQSTN